MLLTHILASIGWTLVYWELAIHTVVSAVVAFFTPFLPQSLKAGGSTWMAWKRCAEYSLQVLSPRMLLKTIPALGSQIRMKMETIDRLFHQSFIFRLLWYLRRHA